LASGIKGAEGVCNIVEALRSPATTLLLTVGIGVAAVAIAVGFSTYRRMDSRRRREQALAGAILGIQAVVLAAFLLWFRSGQTIFAFVRNFLNFTLLQPYIGALFRG